MRWFKESQPQTQLRKALNHIKKASWAVNELDENLSEAYVLLEEMGDKVKEELEHVAAASSTFYPESIDSHLTEAEEILEEKIK